MYMKSREGKSSLFSIINASIMIIVLFITLYPFLHVLAISFSTTKEAYRQGIHIIPLEVQFDSYKRLLSSKFLWKSFAYTIFRTVLGTLIAVFVNALTGYALSKKKLPFRGFFMGMVLFSMIFHGGIIPSYLVVKSLGLINKIWALVLPMAFAGYYTLVLRNFFMGVPQSMEDSAFIDGASLFRTFITIIIPLSIPVIATISLWVAVQNWNAYFDALIYIYDSSKMVLQILLRRVLLNSEVETVAPSYDNAPSVPDFVMQATLIVVSTIPIILVYPFIQKYFTKGLMVGAVKG